MLNIDDSFTLNATNIMSKYLDENDNTLLTFTDFIKDMFPVVSKHRGLTYPYTVKIPKGIDDLIRGDTAPAYELEIKEPITIKIKYVKKNFDGSKEPVEDDLEIWYGRSDGEVFLRFGLLEGDKRFFSKEVLNDKEIHLLFGGRTGMGKSVLMNVVLYALFLEYPWWEIDAVLSDAKIVEFKTYATQPWIPHITAIAATGDVDYLISVLEFRLSLMQKYNTAYTRVQADKLETYREKTGLAIPRHLNVFDEFQTMFVNAGKKAQRLADIIDLFGRLGRNTGFNLMLASQSIGTSIPKETLSQIGVRACLGATPAISDTILNNSEAGGINTKGQLIFNNRIDPPETSRKYNKRYTVPFISPKERVYYAQQLNNLIQKFPCNRTLTFYDEMVQIEDKDYNKYLSEFKYNRDQLFLGEPSEIVSDPEKIVKLKYSNEAPEPIMIVNSIAENLIRYSKMLNHNIQLDEDIFNLVFYYTSSVPKGVGLIDENNKPLGNTVRAKKIEDYKDEIYSSTLISIMCKVLAVEVDEQVFTMGSMTFDELGTNDKIEELPKLKQLYLEILEEYPEFEDNMTNRLRFNTALLSLLNRDKWTISMEFSTDAIQNNINNDDIPMDEFLEGTMYAIFDEYSNADCSSRMLLREYFRVGYVWIFGISTIDGLGSGRTRGIDRLNRVMRESYKVNIRFIIVSNMIGEATELVSLFKWVIFDNPDTRQLSSMKCQDPPNSSAPILGFVFDKPNNKVTKFKKLVFNGELIT